MPAILTVCLGNICRSPLAQGLIGHLGRDLNLTLDSAGTSAHHIGAAPDPRSREVALRHGFDIGQQRARQLETRDFERFDLILAMDRRNFEHCQRMAPKGFDSSRLVLFLERYGPAGLSEVPDPYYGDIKDFEYVYELLYHASLQLVNELMQTNGAGTE